MSGGRDIWLRRVKDEDLRFLSRVANLKSLSIGEAYMTDAGLRHLQTMKTLRRLNFEGSGPTPAGLAQLRQSLPNTKITGPGPIN